MSPDASSREEHFTKSPTFGLAAPLNGTPVPLRTVASHHRSPHLPCPGAWVRARWALSKCCQTLAKRQSHFDLNPCPSSPDFLSPFRRPDHCKGKLGGTETSRPARSPSRRLSAAEQQVSPSLRGLRGPGHQIQVPSAQASDVLVARLPPPAPVQMGWARWGRRKKREAGGGSSWTCWGTKS